MNRSSITPIHSGSSGSSGPSGSPGSPGPTASGRAGRLAGGLALLAASGCLAPPPSEAPEPGEEITMEELGRMIADGAQPVAGTVIDGTLTPDPGDPTALVDPGSIEFDPGFDPGYEDEEPWREDPYLHFGERILVSTHPETGVEVITKPYPFPPGKATKMVQLIQQLQPFPVVALSPDQPKTEPPAPGVVELTVLDNWDTEVYSPLTQFPPTQAKPINVSDLLIATADYELLDQVENFINVFGAGVRQIEIEAKIVEVVESDSYDVGVRAVDPNTPVFDFPDQTFVESLDFSLPNTVDAEALLTLGAVQDGLAFNAVLEALETFSNVSIEQQPKVAVREGVPATISSTQDIPFFTIGGINAAGNFSAQLTFKSVGIEFYVAPRVVGTETLALDIHIEASQQIGSVVVFSTDGSGTNSGTALPAPLIATRTAKTVVYLKPGQSLIIGGLTSERSSESVNKVPILGDLPLLGFFFRSKRETTETSYSMFVISPRIIQSSEFESEL